MIGAIRPYGGRVNALGNPFVFVQIWRQSALLRARQACSPRVISSGVEVVVFGGAACDAMVVGGQCPVSPADYFELRAINIAKQSWVGECHDEGTSVNASRSWPFRWPAEVGASAAGDTGVKDGGVINSRLDMLI